MKEILPHEALFAYISMLAASLQALSSRIPFRAQIADAQFLLLLL
jgi:hypothetical protein